jgi:hypothetical protein
MQHPGHDCAVTPVPGRNPRPWGKSLRVTGDGYGPGSRPATGSTRHTMALDAILRPFALAIADAFHTDRFDAVLQLVALLPAVQIVPAAHLRRARALHQHQEEEQHSQERRGSHVERSGKVRATRHAHPCTTMPWPGRNATAKQTGRGRLPRFQAGRAWAGAFREAHCAR